MATNAEGGITTKAARYFGRLPGQNLKEFAEELKELSDTDKQQLDAGLGDVDKAGNATGTLTY